MWQSLFDELKSHGFIVIAVALDDAEPTRRWVAEARATYPCWVDSQHHVADLYGLVNVPQAVWIDEAGRIVRGPETAGSNDSFRAMNRTTFSMPEEALAERNRVKRRYLDAVRSWAQHGAASPHVLAAEHAAARLPQASAAIAEAHARFRLGRHLAQQGRHDEANAQMAQAARLHPDSWAMWRQAAPKDHRGLAGGPQFWARVDALGDKPYYAPVQP